MNRTKGILAAGSLTGLVLITILALGFQGLGAAAGDGTQTAVSEPTPIVIQQPETGVGADEAVQAWQIYSGDLENTVQTMQQREAQYQAQLEAANQTILQLQDQANSANAAASVQINAPGNGSAIASESAFYDDDDEEHEEHEDHEEDEGEDDDD